jgi:hypothetical protein
MEGLNVCLSEEDPLVSRPPAMGVEAGSWSVSVAKPLRTEVDADDDGGVVDLDGMFFKISSYRSLIKSSLKRPNVEQAAAKPVRVGWSIANWQTFLARRSFGVIKFSTLIQVSGGYTNKESGREVYLESFIAIL